MAVRLADPTYATVLVAMSATYLRLEQYPKAGELFREGQPLANIMKRGATREMVINCAIVDLVQKVNVMHAVKVTRDALAAAKEVDEDLLNLMGTAMNIVDQDPK